MEEVINGILIREVETKNIMTKSSLPVGGYSVNPYVGCTHARKVKSRLRSSPSRKSCRIRQTRKKHKEPPRHRRNTDNRIWNFNRHLPFSIRECQVLFLFSRRDRFECI